MLECVMTANEVWSQVWRELVLLHWNASRDDTVAEVEICYRGQTRFVRRLCASRSHIMGDTELVLKSRGRLENLTVSSFSGYTDEMPHDSAEASLASLSSQVVLVVSIWSQQRHLTIWAQIMRCWCLRVDEQRTMKAKTCKKD